MAKSNLLTGLRPAIKEIYELAKQRDHWICYKKQWYTPSQFAIGIGKWDINIAHVTIENPKDVLKRGRIEFERMIHDGYPKEQLLDGLKRLNAFTDKYRLHCKPNIHEYDL